MSTLTHKVDFALIFSVRNANPNGDPLDGNRPRTSFEGLGEVSDVCLKRKLRNRLQDMGYPILVQADDRRSDGCRSIKDRIDESKVFAGIKDREKMAEAACKTWMDVRTFGQVFAFKGGKGDSEGGVSIGVRGPVTIQTAFSVEPVNVTSTQITKSVNLETGKDPDQRGSDTMGAKHRVDFGLYATFGSINVQLAEKTGFSDGDAEAIKKALATLFENDASAARPDGSMEVVRLYWFPHSSKSGQYSSAKVHRQVKISRKAGVRRAVSADDYEIALEPLPGLAAETIDGI